MVFKSDIIGESVQRIDGPDKVTGETLYTADVVLPGMLCGKILRSPYPHARVRSIDTSKAWGVPGVRAMAGVLNLSPNMGSKPTPRQALAAWAMN